MLLIITVRTTVGIGSYELLMDLTVMNDYAPIIHYSTPKSIGCDNFTTFYDHFMRRIMIVRTRARVYVRIKHQSGGGGDDLAHNNDEKIKRRGGAGRPPCNTLSR